MSRLFQRLIGRSKNSSSRPRKKTRKRRLRSEALESRHLLAANLFHNVEMPEDVNRDGEVTSRDALVVINEMQRRGSDAIPTEGDMMSDVNNDGRRTASDALRIINRLARNRRDPSDNDRPPTDQPTDQQATDTYSTDGTGNNLENPEFGSVRTALQRVADADYADGISEPSGQDRPNPRVISNTLSSADENGTPSQRDLSAFAFIWGQFLDHDIDLSTAADDSVELNIEVPAGDPSFDPFSSGTAEIPFTRSAFAEGTGTSIDNPAQQINEITAWIDGSQIYGSDQETADQLREFVGGRMSITDDGLLPTDDDGNILAGDVRAAENLALTSMHALFVREHNRLADEIAANNPELSDEQIFQRARRVVIAQLQSITYNEFLPALLGQDALSRYRGYDASVDPSIANEFSTAAFRFGHSTLNDQFHLIGNDGVDVADPIALASAFFNPSMLEEISIDPLLKYGASTVSQEVDLQVVDSLRNFLFGPPGAGGLDLVSLNIQRGRDHGLADLNSTRVAYGLQAHDSFDDITSDAELQAKLNSLYSDVNNVDLWVGILAEDHLRGSSLGETASTIIVDQFERLRDGDRLWYQNTLDDRMVRQIENTSLATIIERNTNVDSLQDNVFFFSPEISGTISLADNGVVSPVDTARSTTQRTNRERNRNGDQRDSSAMEGMVVELFDSGGNLIESTVSDANGRYRFTNINITGAYQVHVNAPDQMEVVGNDVLDALVTNGRTQIRQLDFEMIG